MSQALNWIQRTILRKEAMNYFKQLFTHWSTYASAIAVVITFLQPSLVAFMAAHPKSVAGVLVTAALAAYHATAPKDKGENQ